MGGRLEVSLGAYYTDPNDLALVILISLPLCLALLFRSRSRIRKAVWVSVVLVMLYTVFLTGSRGGFIALVLTTAVFLWEFAVRGRRRYLLAVTLIAGVILFQFSSGILMGRLSRTLDGGEDRAEAYDSAQIRQRLLWRSIELTAQHPLFGVGPDNFQQLSGSWHVTHNSFTQMSTEGGLPAFVLYVSILWCGFKNVGKTKQLARGRPESRLWARALLASLVAYCVGSAFLSAAFEYFPYILVAYTTALFSITKKANAQVRRHDFPPTVREGTGANLSMDTPDIELSRYPG
jgi:O-antigen ligase